MAEIKLTKNSRTDEVVRVTCRECKGTTKHFILTDVKVDGAEEWHAGEWYQWVDEYEIVQCQGCETATQIRYSTCRSAS